MQFKDDNYQGRPKTQDDLTMKDLNSFIYLLKQLVEQLSSATSMLPKVDEAGNSECPFAEKLYAQKDECMEKLEKELQKLPRYHAFLGKEIARCRSNLDQISKGASSLNRYETKEKFEAAKRSQQAEYNDAIRKRKDLTDLNSRAEKMLALAGSKAFPGGKPQKGYRVPAEAFGGGEATGSSYRPSVASPGRPSVQNEIDSLISSGPLGRKES
jgi:uncharacterized phage infection (PIP) family protein YhgE